MSTQRKSSRARKPSQGKRNSIVKLPGTVKMVVVGDGAVGKTSMLSTFVTGKFPSEYIPTVFDNHELDRMLDDELAHLKLWDTAGQEEYQSLRLLSYPETDVFLLVFSVDSRNSLENIRAKWIPEIRKYVPSAPLVLVGSKSDLREAEASEIQQNLIPIENCEALAREFDAKYLECSAFKSQNLEQIFDEAIRSARKHIEKERAIAEAAQLKAAKGGGCAIS